jgi:hypothetical protein
METQDQNWAIGSQAINVQAVLFFEPGVELFLRLPKSSNPTEVKRWAQE